MIKLTLKELADAQGALVMLTGVALPIRTSFKVAKLAKACQDDYQVFMDKRNELYKTYGEEVGPEQYQVTEENKDKFTEEFQTLLDTEVKLSSDRLNASDFNGTKSEIMPTVFINLGPLFEEEIGDYDREQKAKQKEGTDNGGQASASE